MNFSFPEEVPLPPATLKIMLLVPKTNKAPIHTHFMPRRAHAHRGHNSLKHKRSKNRKYRLRWQWTHASEARSGVSAPQVRGQSPGESLQVMVNTKKEIEQDGVLHKARAGYAERCECTHPRLRSSGCEMARTIQGGGQAFD